MSSCARKMQQHHSCLLDSVHAPGLNILPVILLWLGEHRMAPTSNCCLPAGQGRAGPDMTQGHWPLTQHRGCEHSIPLASSGVLPASPNILDRFPPVTLPSSAQWGEECWGGCGSDNGGSASAPRICHSIHSTASELLFGGLLQGQFYKATTVSYKGAELILPTTSPNPNLRSDTQACLELSARNLASHE